MARRWTSPRNSPTWQADDRSGVNGCGTTPCSRAPASPCRAIIHDILQIDETVRDHQLERLARTKSTRDNGAVANSLEKLKQAANQNQNTMPAIIEAVAAYATVEEICVALRDVYGVYEEPAF